MTAIFETNDEQGVPVEMELTQLPKVMNVRFLLYVVQNGTWLQVCT